MRVLLGVCLLIPIIAAAQTPSNDYVNRLAQAAPPQVVADATIVQMNGTAIQTLKKGSNEWTCMIVNDVPLCADTNAMAWVSAWQIKTQRPPATQIGFIYMLGTTNPWPMKLTDGSHVMFVAYCHTH